MRGAWWLVILLCGCLQPVTPDLAPDPVTPYREYEVLEWSGQGCSATLVAFLPEYDAVRGHLPAGFAPADAVSAISSPVAPGRALVLVAMLQCLHGSDRDTDLMHSTTAILVAPPTPAEPVANNETLHFYDVSHTAFGWLWTELTFRGWDAYLAESQEVEFVVEGTTVQSTVATPYFVTVEYLDEHGSVDARIATGAAYSERQWDATFWRVANDRLFSMHLDYERAPLVGAVQCAFEGDPAVKQFTSNQDGCLGDVPAIGVLFVDYDFEATLRDEGPWP